MPPSGGPARCRAKAPAPSAASTSSQKTPSAFMRCPEASPPGSAAGAALRRGRRDAVQQPDGLLELVVGLRLGWVEGGGALGGQALHALRRAGGQVQRRQRRGRAGAGALGGAGGG